MLCKEQATLDHEAQYAAKAIELGVDAKVLNAKELATLDPGATMAVAGCVFFPGDGFLTPNLFLSNLRNQVKQLGAEILWDTSVDQFTTDGRRITAISTKGNNRHHPVEQIVIAGGAWSSQLARQLKINLPMQAGKGYSVTLNNPPALPEVCSILTEARVAVTPMNGALRVGGTMEITGLDESITRRRVDGITRSFPRYFPQFTKEMFDDLPVWNGLRPCSPDGLPYIGRSSRFDNLSIATGHAMLGLSLAPITGKMIAELISEKSSLPQHPLLSPDRYA